MLYAWYGLCVIWLRRLYYVTDTYVPSDIP